MDVHAQRVADEFASLESGASTVRAFQSILVMEIRSAEGFPRDLYQAFHTLEGELEAIQYGMLEGEQRAAALNAARPFVSELQQWGSAQ